MKTGDRISGVFYGESFTGTIRRVSHENGLSKILVDGTFIKITEGEWTHIGVQSDEEFKTPSGRTYTSLLIRRSDVETGLVIINEL